MSSLLDVDLARFVERVEQQGGEMTEQTFRIRSWVKADAEQERDGLVGFLSLFVGDLIVDNVTLRRTQAGRYALSWPARTDKHGKKHASVRPLNDEVRQRIEKQIFAELSQREDARTEVQP